MFPQSSYNTPHGYQFGRDAAEFEDTTLNPNIWDEALSEQSFEETHEDIDRRIAAEREQAHAMAISSRAEANGIALPIERQTSRERDVQDIHDIAYVGKLIQSLLRDGVDAA